MSTHIEAIVVTDIQTWIAEGAAAANIEVQRLNRSEGDLIVAAASRKFVAGNPSVWWLALKEPLKVVDSTHAILSDVLPDSGSVYLIPEDELEHQTVYRVASAGLASLLAECPFFEYNVVANDFSWLVAESDHNEFLICDWRDCDE